MNGPAKRISGTPKFELLYSPASPYARKVRVLIRERNALDLFDETVELPLDDSPELRAVNPLGKVPTLLHQGTEPLYDSPLILEYLDEILPGTHYLPTSGMERWSVLRRQALADGIMDAGLAIAFERLRNEEKRSSPWISRWTRALEAGVEALASSAATLPSIPDIGATAVACALGYLDFRHPSVAWRQASRDLSRWFDVMATRPSMLATAPI